MNYIALHKRMLKQYLPSQILLLAAILLSGCTSTEVASATTRTAASTLTPTRLATPDSTSVAEANYLATLQANQTQNAAAYFASVAMMTATSQAKTEIATPPTITLSPTHKPTFTPSPTPKPYLIKRSSGAGDGASEIYHCLTSAYPYPKFILYADGQLIIREGRGFVETYLTTEEIQALLTEIENTGFLELGPPGFYLDDSVVYDLPEGLQYGEGGWGEEISVQGVNVSLIAGISQYAVQPIKDTLSIIGHYQPPRETYPYHPTELTMFILDANTPADELVGRTPALARAWPAGLPDLEFGWLVQYDQSQTSSLIQAGVFEYFPGLGIFTQNGIDYLVIACPSMDAFGW